MLRYGRMFVVEHTDVHRKLDEIEQRGSDRKVSLAQMVCHRQSVFRLKQLNASPQAIRPLHVNNA